MKFILTFESAANELDKVKKQFFDYLNSIRTHHLKFDKLPWAAHQGFCQTYGYDFNHNSKSQKSFFPQSKYYKIFTQETLERWFLQWKEIEMSKVKGRGKYQKFTPSKKLPYWYEPSNWYD